MPAGRNKGSRPPTHASECSQPPKAVRNLWLHWTGGSGTQRTGHLERWRLSEIKIYSIPDDMKVGKQRNSWIERE